MSIQAMVDAMNEASKAERSNYHVTLGQLREALQGCEGDLNEWKVATVFRKDLGREPYHGLGEISSYRGYYSDAAIEPSPEPTTVNGLLAEVEKVIGKKLTGYKGGQFHMDPETPLWVSAYGVASQVAVLDTEKDEDGKVFFLVLKQLG